MRVMHLLVSVLFVIVHVIYASSESDSLWNVPRQYIDAVREWVVPTQSPISTTTKSSSPPPPPPPPAPTEHIWLDPHRDPSVNKTEAWLDTMKRSIPGGWNSLIGGGKSAEQQQEEPQAAATRSVWTKLKEAWRGSSKVEQPNKPKPTKDDERKAKERKSGGRDTQIGTNSPPGNVPKKPSVDPPPTPTKSPDELDRLIPSAEVLNELRCHPRVSFMSCVDHCQQVIPAGTPLGPSLRRRLEASTEEEQEESNFDYRSLHDDAFEAVEEETDLEVSSSLKDSAVLATALVPDFFLVGNTKHLASVNDTARVGHGGDRSPQVGGLLKKSEGWDALQASQLKSCLFNVCVVDYLKKAVPGCLGPDGTVVPLNGDRHIRDPDLRPGRPEDFDTFDFYDPNRLEFWRHLGLFKWHRFWHELNDQGFLRRLIFIPLLLAASIALPGLLVATILPFFADMLPQDWMPTRPSLPGSAGRPADENTRPPPPPDGSRQRQASTPTLRATLQGQCIPPPASQSYDWAAFSTTRWRDWIEEARQHPGLVAQRAASWVFVNTADPVFRATYTVKRAYEHTRSFLQAILSGVDDNVNEVRETELQTYAPVAGPLLSSGQAVTLPREVVEPSTLDRKSLVMSHEESSQDFSTVPTVPDRDS